MHYETHSYFGLYSCVMRAGSGRLWCKVWPGTCARLPTQLSGVLNNPGSACAGFVFLFLENFDVFNLALVKTGGPPPVASQTRRVVRVKIRHTSVCRDKTL